MAQQQTQPTAADRSKIEVAIADGVNKIWRHTRENQHSLESERHTRLIREIMDKVIAASVAFYVAEVESTRSASKGAKSRVKELQEEVKRLRTQIERLRDEQTTD